ncbi:MAG: RCC1 repeat- and reductase domain-containing protein [Myxococcales bacterium]|nr:RCC1 repeat- and reductase domain-containing protein [Myxococcales bacterium]
MWTRGRNIAGCLGDGSPMTLFGHREAAMVPGLTGVVSVSVGTDNTYAVKSDGTVWSWGKNAGPGAANIGYLGDGTKVDRATPGAALITGVAEVQASSGPIFARKTDGTLWAWGDGFAGALGLGGSASTPTPTQIPGLVDVTGIANGGDFAFALQKDGTVWSWGRNNSGQLGRGEAPLSTDKPGQISTLSGVVSICVRGGDTAQGFAVKSDGTVWGWGYNYGQELGVDTSPVTRVMSPVQVTGITGAAAISCGALHTMVRKTDGTVWGWGVDWAVGLGSTPDGGVKVPTAVPGLSSIKRVFAQQRNTFAWTTSGLMYAWGDDSFGQLGAGKVAGGRADHPTLVTNAF